MPRPNRVSPFGDLVAVPERGLLYGNRGCLHDEQGRIRRRTFGGYAEAADRPDGPADVLTPPSLRSVLAAGWFGEVPLLHPSASAG